MPRLRTLVSVCCLMPALAASSLAQTCPQPSGKDTYLPGFFYEEFLPVYESPLAAQIASGAVNVPRDYWKLMWRAANACQVDVVPLDDGRTFTFTLLGANVSALPASGTLELVDRFGQHLTNVPFSVVGTNVSMGLPLFREAVVIPLGVLNTNTQWHIDTTFPLLHSREGRNTITSGYNWRGSYQAIMAPMVVWRR